MIFRTVDTDQTGLVSHDELLKLLRTKRRCGGLSALLPLIISVSFNGIETFVAVLSTSQVAGVQAMGFLGAGNGVFAVAAMGVLGVATREAGAVSA